MLERRRSAVPSTAEPVKTSSSASALIVIASFPEELLPSPIVLRVKCLIRRNGNAFPRYGRNLLVHSPKDLQRGDRREVVGRASGANPPGAGDRRRRGGPTRANRRSRPRST